MVNEIPVFPTLYRAVLVPVNKRILNYAMGTEPACIFTSWRSPQDKPVVAEK